MIFVTVFSCIRKSKSAFQPRSFSPRQNGVAAHLTTADWKLSQKNSLLRRVRSFCNRDAVAFKTFGKIPQFAFQNSISTGSFGFMSPFGGSGNFPFEAGTSCSVLSSVLLDEIGFSVLRCATFPYSGTGISRSGELFLSLPLLSNSSSSFSVFRM